MGEEVRVFSYPGAAVVADLVRSVPGLGLCGALGGVALVDGSPVLALFFVAVALLFLWLAGQAFLRWRGSWQLDETGIRTLPAGRVYHWQELKEWRLRYWAGFRQAREGRGTLALSLYFQAQGQRRARVLRFESALTDFGGLVEEVAQRASAQGASADEHTRHNYHHLRGGNPPAGAGDKKL